MFTGLIEEVGTILRILSAEDVTELEIRAPGIASTLARGDSVAVMGACLTVTSLGRNSFRVEMMEETVRKTKLGKLIPGSPVNLERAMRLGGRLDGHLVTGHVDGIGFLEGMEGKGRTRLARFTTGKDLACLIVPKGSVALDGVSLTVIDADPQTGLFSVGLIPETLRRTTLGSLSVNDPVNLETDLIAKYVRRFLAPAGNEPRDRSSRGEITWDTLRENGWM